MKQQGFTPTSEGYKSEQQPMFEYHAYHYYRCPKCSQVTTYPIPDKHTILEQYDRKFNEVIFEAHRKKLPVNFVFNMLQNYGPKFHRLFKPVYTRLPEQWTRLSLRFYVGQMLVLAHKP